MAGKNGKNPETPEKSKKENKPNIFARIVKRTNRWFREMRSELKKVVWPTPKQLVNNSWVVIVTVLLVGVMIAGFDWVMQTIVNALIGITA